MGLVSLSFLGEEDEWNKIASRLEVARNWVASCAVTSAMACTDGLSKMEVKIGGEREAWPDVKVRKDGEEGVLPITRTDGTVIVVSQTSKGWTETQRWF